MKPNVFYLGAATLGLCAVAAVAIGRIDSTPPLPQVSLGVMKACAHIGALAQKVATDRSQGIELDESRYRYYSRYLRRSQQLFKSPRLAIAVAYRHEDLQPRTIKNLGVQTCVAAYYGFNEATHQETLYREARSCEKASEGETERVNALNDCMGDEYQRLIASWWKEQNS